MSNLLKMMAGGAAAPLYVDDVFTSYVRTGTGAEATVTTNIDMTKGYMIWSKGRSDATDHAIYDSARGVTYDLVTNSTAAQTTQAQGLKSVSSTGHTLGTLAKINTNTSTYVDWVFRKAPKFFDVVTYTGDGTSSRQVVHALGATVGKIIVKRIDSVSNWISWNLKSDGNYTDGWMNLTDASANSALPTMLDITSIYFNPGKLTTYDGYGQGWNISGATYVAYLFAHDTASDGMIQCGSYTGTGADNNAITLNFEPQFLMIKRATVDIGGWIISDVMRGIATPTTYDSPATVNHLSAESSDAEAGAFTFGVTATGFNLRESNTQLNSNGDTYIYLAIRRPNKPPTSGTQVYNAIARTGTGAVATVTGVGFPPDLVKVGGRNLASGNVWFDRLRGATKYLSSYNTSVETTNANSVLSYDMDGVTLGADVAGDVNLSGGYNYINHFFRRYPGVFDVVCDTGTGAAHTISHNLGAIPELMIRKGRSGATQWEVWHSGIANTEKLVLNDTAAKATDTTAWNSTSPTASVFTVGTGANVNTNTATYVTYLFATLAGISKVGSYTGNGSSQTINCGFTTGARFVLIKRTDSTGDWYVWDSVRGIIAGNDPHLSLNTTVAEVTTDDSIDPDSSGFIVNQLAATNINVTSATYLFLCMA